MTLAAIIFLVGAILVATGRKNIPAQRQEEKEEKEEQDVEKSAGNARQVKDLPF